MARYTNIDDKKFPKRYDSYTDFARGWNACLGTILKLPTADVVPKSEFDEVNTEWAEAYKKLEYTLVGVMYRVDKWLEGEELEQDEVGRAIAMRKKTLQIVKNAENKVEFLRKTIAENAQQALEVTLEEIEKAKTEVAREIFEEMDGITELFIKGLIGELEMYDRLAKLKKKHTKPVEIVRDLAEEAVDRDITNKQNEE